MQVDIADIAEILSRTESVETAIIIATFGLIALYLILRSQAEMIKDILGNANILGEIFLTSVFLIGAFWYSSSTSVEPVMFIVVLLICLASLSVAFDKIGIQRDWLQSDS